MQQSNGSDWIVVTGAGSGIGYATTDLLLQEGYHVLALDRVPGRLAGITHERLTFHAVDVRDKAAIAAALEATPGAEAGLYGLVACAAVFRRVPFLDLDEETWDETFDVNLKGGLFACQAVLPSLLQRGEGSIVLFSSTLARSGSPTGTHYAATKGGVLGLARSMAVELALSGVRVNVVSPGLTDTPQPRGHSSEEQMRAKAAQIPFGRMGEACEMADAALFLLDREASFVTGQDIRVNGGGQLI